MIYKYPSIRDQALEEQKNSKSAIQTNTQEGYEVERIEGNCMYLKGIKHPHKGIPTPETIYAINIVKKLLFSIIRLSPFLIIAGKRKIISLFTDIGYRTLRPFILKREYMCEASRTMMDLIYIFITGIGMKDKTAIEVSETIAHIFEYDTAYRFRVQDLAGETTAQKLIDSPFKEITRLIRINKERDYKTLTDETIQREYRLTSDKFKLVGMVIKLILLFPKYRRAYRLALYNIGIDGMMFDEGDRYWASQKIDYKYNV